MAEKVPAAAVTPGEFGGAAKKLRALCGFVITPPA
jgi:hypothetical protein